MQHLKSKRVRLACTVEVAAAGQDADANVLQAARTAVLSAALCVDVNPFVRLFAFSCEHAPDWMRAMLAGCVCWSAAAARAPRHT